MRASDAWEWPVSAEHPAPTPEQLLADPAASYWLKESVASGLRRDPLDVAADAEVLAGVFSQRALAILAASS